MLAQPMQGVCEARGKMRLDLLPLPAPMTAARRWFSLLNSTSGSTRYGGCVACMPRRLRLLACMHTRTSVRACLHRVYSCPVNLQGHVRRQAKDPSSWQLCFGRQLDRCWLHDRQVSAHWGTCLMRAVDMSDYVFGYGSIVTSLTITFHFDSPDTAS
jgi:hypothetical protein